MALHTEAEVVRRAGASLVLGGVRKDVPALTAAKNEEFQAKLGGRFRALWAGISSVADWDAIFATVATSDAEMVGVIVDYDVEGRAGGREWIWENATSEEIYEAFKAVIRASFPFTRDLERYPTLLFQVLEQVTALSQSSPSPSGASTTETD